MNNMVTLDTLASFLAKDCGLTEEFAHKFVSDFFATVESALMTDESVDVEGLGEFVLNESNKVVFRPAEVLAAAVNEPFDCFEPIELEENEVYLFTNEEVNPISESELLSENEPANSVDSEDTSAINSGVVNDENDKTIDQEFVEDLHEESIENEENAVLEYVDQSVGISTEDNSNSDTQDDDTEFESDVKKSHKLRTFCFGMLCGLAIGAALTYLLLDKWYLSGVHPEAESKSDAITIVADDATANDLSVQSDHYYKDVLTEDVLSQSKQDIQMEDANEVKVIKDTVRSGNYLAAMSRRHYGRFEFWVYIYEENASVLKNPDLIEPNTEVVIPPAEKYGIDASDPASVKRAVALAEEIYSRFGKRNS